MTDRCLRFLAGQYKTERPVCCINYPSPCPLGGFFVGVLENIAGAYVVGTELKLSVALVIIVGVLVFKPAGLFGRMCCNFVIEPKVGEMTGILVRRREQTENEVVQ